MSSTQSIQDQEEHLRDLVRQLPDAERLEFFRQAEGQLKDPDTYATLNYLFIAGLHHFYLGRFIRGLINVLVFCAGLVLLVAGYAMVGIVIIVTITVLELYALFDAQNIVAEHNNKVMEQIYNSLLVKT